MLTPLKSIRKFCLWCCDNQFNEVLLCPKEDCVFYKFRRGKGRPRLKYIRMKCKDCGTGTHQAIKNCEFIDCPIYHFRFGHRPTVD